MDVSKRLVELRKYCGLSQNALADIAGVSQSHLRRVELGQADITVGHLQLLCDAMDITLQDFFKEQSSKDEMLVTLSKLTSKQKRLLIDFIESL